MKPPVMGVIAIDGPAGSGKSSTARGVATRLGWRYLDTGALYRAMTWWMVEHDVDVEDADAVRAASARPVIEVDAWPDRPRVRVDGVDVSTQIREPRIAQAVSAVSRVREVREVLLALQRSFVEDGEVVIEGRDIGTVVAPDAGLKIFLVADASARARRRAKDLGRDGDDGVARTQAALARRDALDSGREVSPLAKAPDAIEIDTTDLSLDEVVDQVVAQATMSA